MRILFSSLVVMMSLTATLALANPATTPATRPATGPAGGVVRVMSFNVRNSGAKDGENRWANRRELLVGVIKAYDPDLLGLQEVLADQADYLRESLPAYGFAGTGRDDNARKGEFSPVMYRKERYELVESGQYWLSEKPDTVASKGWDAALPRIVTWARLKDRASGAVLLFSNTHWDHVGDKARVESAKLMRRRTVEAGDGVPAIIAGDFNSTEDQPQYDTLVNGSAGGAKMTDAFRAVHPQAGEEEASFHGFKGKRAGKRIDWILASPGWKVLGAGIDRTEKAGRFPSDHFAVTAELESAR